MTAAAGERAHSILDRIRPRLIQVVTVGVGVVALVAYLFGVFFGEHQPNSPIGLFLGVLAALSLTVVMGYSARRSRPHVRTLGPSRVYYGLHVWVGLLFCVLLLLHSDLRVPRSGFGFALWILGLWVVFSGAIGWFLQWLVPKIITPAASFEVNYQRIPELVDDLRGRAESVVARGDPRIRSLYEQQMAPDFAAPRMSVSSVFGSSRGAGGSGAVALLRRTLSPEGVTVLDSLCEIHATKREIDMHFTLQRVLRLWLFFHLPVAIALLGAVVMHLFFVAYF